MKITAKEILGYGPSWDTAAAQDWVSRDPNAKATALSIVENAPTYGGPAKSMRAITEALEREFSGNIPHVNSGSVDWNAFAEFVFRLSNRRYY